MEPLHRLSELILVSQEEAQTIFTRIGQILKAQVIEKLTDSRFFLKFNEQLILAETSIPLIPGEIIKVRVEALRPKILLKLLPKKQSSSSKSIKDLEFKDPISALFKKILSWQEHDIKQTLYLLLADKEKIKKDFFWKLLAGICLSSKKKEKSILEKLFFTFLESESNKEKKEIIKNFLSYLTWLRDINHHLKEKGLYLRWPIQWNKEFKDFEVFIGHYFFHFRLELEHLKKLEGIIRLENQNDLFLDFLVEKEEIAKFIQTNIFQLYKILEILNFKIKGFHCEVANKEYWQKDLWINLTQITLVDVRV